MRDSIGGLSIMSIFIFFFIMVAFFLVGTILYYKGFKINSQLINSLEKYEGYNRHSAADMDRIFNGLGYRSKNSDGYCGQMDNGGQMDCLGENRKYEFELECTSTKKNVDGLMSGRNYYITYKVKTYIYIDLPLGMTLKIPITSKTNPIYQFTGNENGVC